MSGDKKLAKEKDLIQQSENLSNETKQALQGNYLTEMKNSEGIESQHTLAKHLQRLRIMFEAHPDKDWSNQVIDKELSRTIRDEIQNSEYKSNNTKYSSYAERTKKDYWTCLNYWIKHIQGQNPDDVTPKATFNSDKKDVDKQAETRPQDLPNPNQMRKLLKTLAEVSEHKTAKRNQAFYGLIWDLGTRVGETLPLQMKDVDISQDRVRIYVTGNKDSGNDWVTLWQTQQLFREYIQQHPDSDNPEAYVFPQTYYNNSDKPINKRSLKKKMIQAKNRADLDFKTRGEPFHIFRKASSTFYVVNDIISWGEVCKRQRKKEDSTKPDYILRAMQDVDQSIAKGLGIEKEDTQSNGVMTGTPLMPKKCGSCGTVNNCLKDSCTSCQTTLPENTLPTPEIKVEQEEKRKAEVIGRIKGLKDLLDKTDDELEDYIQ